jgi:thioredoxin-related protein
MLCVFELPVCFACIRGKKDYGKKKIRTNIEDHFPLPTLIKAKETLQY